MNVLPLHGVALLPVAALLLYSLYRRYRRHVGPQEVTPLRMGLRALLLCGLAVFILVLPRSTLLHLGLIGGIATGIALGLFSLLHTRFETRGAKHYYIPNIYIGLAVSALFALRLIYRFAVLYPQMQQAGGGFHLPNPGDPLAAMGGSKSLLTLAMLGVVIGYYASYYAGVLLQSRRAVATQPIPAVETDGAG